MSGKAKKVREKKETTGSGICGYGLKSGGSDAGISSNCRRDRNLSWLYLG